MIFWLVRLSSGARREACHDELDHPDLSIGRQCALLSISRSSFYRSLKGEMELNLDLTRLIDEHLLKTLFHDLQQMNFSLRNISYLFKNKRTQQLMAS